MALSVRRFIGGDGERHAILVDEAGMPLFYPALWVTVTLRGGARAVNTIHNALNAIKCLYAWQDIYALDVEHRFSRGALLNPYEVHSLRDFLQESLSQKADGKVIPFSRKKKTVSPSSQYARMTVAAEFLEFLARRVCPSSEESEKRIAAMVAQIKANRPKQTTKTMGGEREEKHLEDSALDALETKLRPGAEGNPFTDYSVQFRNALMFAILRTTGMRRGELLNLKVDDINFGANILKIVRRPDSPHDIRRYQPVAKTRERQFPLDAELVNRIHEYVAQHRSKLAVAKRHGYLFVTHKEGRYQGAPISNSAFSKFIEALTGIVGAIHAHKLRHHWNYSFSSLSAAKGLSAAREEKLRSYLMGWEQNSGTAAIYNRRHIKQEAAESMLELQCKMLAKKKDSTNDQ
ncbi:site-specific integrase [Pseudomonas sp. Irchel 3A18]|uniref:tyrosine-type recombinase/integrase n=1 Tax=Pseudomonas sp. Irchel 3A18 TaxID=2008905 RepID=UPI000BA44020|nr:site-specific integrase [Pseudomonas sp. Irchel 3A18]